MSFLEQAFLILKEFNLSIFNGYAFGVKPKNSKVKFFPMFSSKRRSFVFHIQTLIHFELILNKVGPGREGKGTFWFR